MKKLIFVWIFVLVSSIVYGADEFKPYLHNPEVPENPGLKLYGSYSTNLFPGAATYSYTLEVPAGKNGMTPKVSLSYNSQSVKQRPGIIGAGWQMTNYMVFRDVNSTPLDETDDEFFLVMDGSVNELVYDTEYRVKHDNYLKIENLSDRWLVRSKDGTLYTFVTKVNSDGNDLKWYLDNITDTYGNQIYYSYSTDPNPEDINAVYLQNISYNDDRSRVIEFSYENNLRPDRRRVYEHGSLFEESRRLEHVTVYTNDDIVRRYAFEYVNTVSSSSLSQITFIGNDNTSVLNNVSFEYYNTTIGYTKYDHSKYTMPTFFTETSGADFGVRAVDFNNDGYIDIVKARTQGPTNTVWINNKSGGFIEDVSWEMPMYITDSVDADNGVRFADINSDGLVDILHSSYDGGSFGSVYLNNGSGWENATSTWQPPLFFTVSTVTQPVRLIDFNGDGKTDIIHADNDSGGTIKDEFYLNNGSGWVNVSSDWDIPEVFIYNSKEAGTRLIDLNGDGLMDLIRGYDTGLITQKGYLNNGSGWVNDSTWDPPIIITRDPDGEKGVRLVDVNGDGLTDLLVGYTDGAISDNAAYINNGSGWVNDSTWIPPDNFTDDGDNIGRRIADVNGDGWADLLIGFTNNYTYIRNGSFPLMLKRVVNEYGGVIDINYTTSTSFNNSGNDSISDLGFNLWVVDNVSRDNSLSGDFNVVGNTLYNYSGGLYDYSELEFRGFANVTETKADNSTVVHFFHQSEALKGREFKTEVFDSAGALFSQSLNEYNDTTNGSFRIFMISQENHLFDGQSTARVTNISYSYDGFGNVLTKKIHGVGEEPKNETFSYAVNTSAYIVDKVKLYRLLDENNIVVKEVKNNYDNEAFGVVTKGSVTQTESLNDNGTNPVSRFTYDSFGNLKTEVDPRGFTTSYLYGLYDTSNTYVNQITNALGHRRLYHYDLGTGNLLWDEKNGIKTEYEYDAFGRKIKDVLPLDSFSEPSKEYNYSIDGSTPEIILVRDKTLGNETQDTYFYYDGFANLVQLKRDGEGNQIVKNIFYDGLFRVGHEQNPYFESFSTELSTPSTTVNKTFYTYDGLGRINLVLNPDGTNETINFNRDLISTYDANDNRKDYVLDGQDRISNVIEYNNQLGGIETYNTTYQYDIQDNLIQITDTLGNEFKFSYDTLGRKISMDDPDLGRWVYQYDASGNLVEQVGAGGQLVTGDGYYREYDDFGQLVRIREGNNASAPLLEAYEYDESGIRQVTIKYYTNNGSIKEKTFTPNREFTQIVNSSGEFNFTYIYLDNTLVSRLDPNGSKYFYMPDHLGSTSLILDENGDIVEETFYHPYGGVESDPVKETKVGYTGHEFDEDTGQVYMKARYYKPEIGQFVSADPFIADIYNPQSLNRNSYVLNNPMKYNDPDGNNPVVLGIAGFVVGSVHYMVTTPVSMSGSGWARVGKTFAHGGLWAANAATLGQFSIASGTLRVGAKGGFSSALKRFAVGSATAVGDKLIDSEEPTLSGAVIGGLSTSIPSPWKSPLKGGMFAATNSIFRKQVGYSTLDYLSQTTTSGFSSYISHFVYNTYFSSLFQSQQNANMANIVSQTSSGGGVSNSPFTAEEFLGDLIDELLDQGWQPDGDDITGNQASSSTGDTDD